MWNDKHFRGALDSRQPGRAVSGAAEMSSPVPDPGGTVNVNATVETPPAPRRTRVKMIPPGMRKGRARYRAESVWYKRPARRLAEDPAFQRSTVQLAFALLCFWIGVEFYLFVQWGMSGGERAFFPRPPGVEGFLPISALMSLKYWLATGIINDVHPSALFILIAVLATSILVKKAFCSWLCPIGTLSESLWMLGHRMLGKNLRLPRWLDYPLRLLKYFLLFFFVWAIWNMDVPSLKAFIYSPYNKMADVKMYQFFAQLSLFAFWTIAVLVLLSIVVKNFWCRYLCPYGALLGMVSWLSPVKVTRSTATCIDCVLCTKACPSNIPVHELARVRSDECTGCLECVVACPVKNTLEMRLAPTGRAITERVIGGLVVGVFIAIIGFAMISGHWANSLTPQEYQRRFQEIDSPTYQHMMGEVPSYGNLD